MKTYISLLRGINVSAQKKILMTELKSLYENLGFQNVHTYIQSGNVVFNSGSNIPLDKIIEKIEQAIVRKYNFSVSVLIRTVEELNLITAANPFLNEKNINTEKLYVTFLSEVPVNIYLDSLKKLDYSPDKFIVAGKEIFLYCVNGYGKTKLSNNYIENKLKLNATTRNWKTVNKLFELASEQIKTEIS